VTGFYGNFEHTLDAKGRLILPARFRPAFLEGGYLTRHYEGSLAMYLPEDFQRIAAEHSLLTQSLERSERDRARVFFDGVDQFTMDGQGRILLSAKHREFARITDSAFFLGSSTFIEIWNIDHYRARTKSAAEILDPDSLSE